MRSCELPFPTFSKVGGELDIEEMTGRVEDPGESGEVRTANKGAPMQPKDPHVQSQLCGEDSKLVVVGHYFVWHAQVLPNVDTR